MPYYPFGRYWGKVITAQLGVTSNGNPQVVIHFSVKGKINPDDPDGALLTCPDGDRTIYSVITEKRHEWAIKDLHELGYDEHSFKYLDPEEPGYKNLAGTEFACECKHEAYQGKTSEKWSVLSSTGPAAVKPLDKAGIRQLDALYGKKLKEGVVPKEPAATAYSAPEEKFPSKEQVAAAGGDIPF